MELEKTIYHLTRIDSDRNGNPQYKVNVFIQPTSDGVTLRLQTDRLGFKFSKKHDAYIFKYHGNEKQAHDLVRAQIFIAGYDWQGVIA